MDFNVFSDEFFMRQAIVEAKKAMKKDEVPIGAVIVCQNQIIARAHNLCESLNDATAHAEMQAFTSASNYLSSKYLNNCRLFVTLEPCVMCAGASYWVRISEIIFGASDKKKGFLTLNPHILHPSTKVKKGIYENECSQMLKDFFKTKR